MRFIGMPLRFLLSLPVYLISVVVITLLVSLNPKRTNVNKWWDDMKALWRWVRGV